MDDAAGRYIADVLQAVGFFEGNAPAVLGVRDFVIRMAVDGIFRVASPNHRVVDVVDENAGAGDERIVIICKEPDPMRRGELDLRDAVFHLEAREPVFDEEVFGRADGHAHRLGQLGRAAVCGDFHRVVLGDDERFDPAELHARPRHHAAGQKADEMRGVAGLGANAQARDVNLVVRAGVHQAPVAEGGQVVFKIRKPGQAELRREKPRERAIEAAPAVLADGFGQQHARAHMNRAIVDCNRAIDQFDEIAFQNECRGDVVEPLTRLAA